MLYADGKLIYRNNVTRTMDCYSVREDNGRLNKLWSVAVRPKWEDQGVFPCGGRVLPDGQQRSSLLVLRLDNQLERYDLQTGVKKEEMFLSNRFRYTEMSQVPETGWVS